YSPLSGFRVLGGNSKNSNPKFTRERQIFHYTFLFDAYDVSDAAYDKAVEVVADAVRQETHKEDIRLVEETKKWVLSPERKAPKKEREYAAARLDGVITKIKNAMQGALAKIQRTLMQPEIKQAGKEQIKEKARESIKDKIAKAKVSADRKNRERWEREGRIDPAKKQDMEL
ncbi:hypothetical protein, partial [Enterocloster clostridioformis]|uniref:hypothetical protein n=1 Tax=Enterocloster clostridioformis TaxID=1531 RepID=UPI000AD773D4